MLLDALDGAMVCLRKSIERIGHGISNAPACGLRSNVAFSGVRMTLVRFHRRRKELVSPATVNWVTIQYASESGSRVYLLQKRLIK
jgi:hypothetical protein